MEYPADYPYAPQPTPPGDPPRPAAALPRQPLSVRIPVLEPSLVASSMLFNLAIGPLVEGFDEPTLLIGLAYGTLCAQLAALSLWTVWSQRPAWQRLVLAIFVGQVLFFCFLAGIGLSSPIPNFAEIARVMLCSLPLVMLSTQLPLWALRIYFGWRLTGECDLAAGSPRPLSIGDILLGTVAAAAAVSLVRLASDDPAFYELAWFGWAVAVPGIAAASLVSVPPALYLALRVERPVSGLHALWGYATAALILALVLAVFLGGARLRAEMLVVAFVGVYVFTATLWGLLQLVRSRDYRLAIRG